MSDFESPDAGWYFDQFEALCQAGGKVSREQFVSTCHVFRAAGYNEGEAAASDMQGSTPGPEVQRVAEVQVRASALLAEPDYRADADG